MVRMVAAVLLLSACGPDAADKLATLPMREETRAALGRLRWRQLHDHDKLRAGDILLCGIRDRALVGFSRGQVVDYLGRDSAWLLPELFSAEKGEEVLLAVPPEQLMRFELPRGIGVAAPHPEGWIREVAGYPLVSSDPRVISDLFASGEVQELFALREEEEPTASVPSSADPAQTPETWRLGVRVFPRIGPRTGVVISGVLPGSPAEAAGLGKGDRIVRFAGLPVTNFRELQRALRGVKHPVVTLDVRKKMASQTSRLTLDLSR
jgi:hypothetical protein